MKNALNLFAVIAIVVGVLVGAGAFYIVEEYEQVVITRFGEPIGNPVTKTGLHFKYPIAHTANYFDKRILQWDGDPNEIQTLEKRYIWIDTTARWRINDALKFMQSVRTENSAQARLDDIIDGATRDVIANHIQREAIRNSNNIIERQNEDEESYEFALGLTDIEPIKVGREKLSQLILEQSIPLVKDLGIDLIDVRIKRINYIQDVRDKVYDRMISERNAAAAKYRSEGQGKRAEIEGQMTKQLENIRAEAYKTAQEIKGKADAQVIKIYADAYNNDPEFYSFIRTLESYSKTIDEGTTLILSTDNAYFQQLEGKGLKRSTP